MSSKNDAKALGEMLAKLRKEKKLSYEAIADKAALAAQLIEDIEKGAVSPSIGALKSIARALDTPLSDFFQQAGLSEKEIEEIESRKDVVHIQRGKRRALSVKGSRAEIELLTPSRVAHNIELLWQEVEARSSGGDWLTHEGEECCLVVKGSVRLLVDEDVFELAEGDSLWFRTNQPHKWENPSDKPATLLWAITPPYHGKV
jgi:transcriptional regulator with XRE-family HTH domain